MTAAEIEQYAAALEKNLVMEPQIKAAFIKGVREWAASDDGRPVLLINLMRFRRAVSMVRPPCWPISGKITL